MNESRGFPGSWLTSPESPGTAATRAYLFRVEVGSASERHLEVLQGKGVMHDRVDMDECMKSIDLRSNLGLIRRHGGCSGLGVTKWPKSHASFAASRDRVVPSCLHSPLSLARAAHQLCLGLPSMVLTQRLKKRNQSDSVLAESHNDEQKNDIHDVHQIQERQAKVLKKKKVRDT